LQWQSEAECRGTASNMFFPPSSLSADELYQVNQIALEICKACSVREECLEFAVENPSLVLAGTWGGKTDKQLRALRRRRGKENAVNLGR